MTVVDGRQAHAAPVLVDMRHGFDLAVAEGLAAVRRSAPAPSRPA